MVVRFRSAASRGKFRPLGKPPRLESEPVMVGPVVSAGVTGGSGPAVDSRAKISFSSSVTSPSAGHATRYSFAEESYAATTGLCARGPHRRLCPRSRIRKSSSSSAPVGPRRWPNASNSSSAGSPSAGKVTRYSFAGAFEVTSGWTRPGPHRRLCPRSRRGSRPRACPIGTHALGEHLELVAGREPIAVPGDQVLFTWAL